MRLNWRNVITGDQWVIVIPAQQTFVREIEFSGDEVAVGRYPPIQVQQKLRIPVRIGSVPALECFAILNAVLPGLADGRSQKLLYYPAALFEKSVQISRKL